MTPVLPHIERAVSAISAAVASEFELELAHILSRSNQPYITQARSIAFYLAYETPGASYPQIARAFGFAEHTTVMNARKKIAKVCAIDIAFRNRVDRIRRKVAESVSGYPRWGAA